MRQVVRFIPQPGHGEPRRLDQIDLFLSEVVELLSLDMNMNMCSSLFSYFVVYMWRWE